MHEPTWVSRVVTDAVHHAQLQEHGGRFGTRDEGAIDSALARPQNKYAHETSADIADLAAAYLFGLATSHGYVDGNKRTALAVSLIFLDLNGYDIDRTDEEVEAVAIAVAARRTDESELARWIREALVSLPPAESESESGDPG
jgi:death-on-curing protein